MKKIIILYITLFCASLFPQTPSESILNLKQDFKNNPDLIHSSTIGHPVYLPIGIASNIQPAKKSGFMAVVYSMLLPGMGDLYAGNYNSGKYFTIAEGALWGFWAGFNLYGDWQKDNYKSFATAQGGVNPEGKDDDYYAEIGKYIDIDIYNYDKSLNREYDAMYNQHVYFWKWEDNNERKEYRNIWLASERAYNNVRFAVGAMIVNRIVSAINAALAVKRYNKNLEPQTSWNFSAGVNQNSLHPELKFNFQTSF